MLEGGASLRSGVMRLKFPVDTAGLKKKKRKPIGTANQLIDQALLNFVIVSLINRPAVLPQAIIAVEEQWAGLQD